jgi:hypothetical protein
VFLLRVRDKSGRVVSERRTNSKQADIVLGPGNYTWSVAFAEVGLESERRKIEVIEPRSTKTEEARLRLLRELIASGRSVTLSLDEGL